MKKPNPAKDAANEARVRASQKSADLGRRLAAGDENTSRGLRAWRIYATMLEIFIMQVQAGQPPIGLIPDSALDEMRRIP